MTSALLGLEMRAAFSLMPTISPPLICFPACSHAIVSSSVGPEYYVSIMSFVDKTQALPLVQPLAQFF